MRSGMSPSSGESLIEEERPLEVPGFLIAPNLVLAHDPETPSRFISKIQVRFGDTVVDAIPIAFIDNDAGVLLKLASALTGTSPVTFAEPTAPSSPNPEAKDAKRFSVHWAPGDGDWSLTVHDAAATLDVESPDGEKRARAEREPDQLVVDDKGHVQGIWLIGSADLDADRSADPRRWPQHDEAAMKAMLSDCASRADNGVLHVSLNFRSPRKSEQASMMGDETDVATELETLGVLLTGVAGEGRMLVLAELDAKTTARLEKIVVHDASGKEHEATFVASLHDWGAFVAKTPDSLAGGTALAKDSLVAQRNRLLPVAHVRMVGRTRQNDPAHLRMQAFRPGFRRIQFPVGVANDESAFAFLPSGELLAIPLATRKQPGQDRGWRGPSIALCGGSVLGPILAELDKHSDATNVPLSEADESRTGWLGVMLQPLDPELARANNVAEFTRDGEFGGIVTFVYPDSPAAKAGIQPGAILLTARTERRQKPIEIAVGRGDLGFRGVFPWERLDTLPEEYYDQVPAPWPPIDDTLAKTLTELGIGSTYTLEFVQDGKKTTKDFTVSLSPPHYGNAPRFESKELGVTVRDATLEVRQYLAMEPGAPGVVVAKLEPGQRASVAGLRPLEVITHVDDAPVTDAATFGTLIEGKKDLKLTVKRASKERVVRVAIEN